MPNILIFDTETSGLPLWKEPSEHPDQPHIVQLAGMEIFPDGTVQNEFDMIVKPDGWTIPEETVKIHGITTERAISEGKPLAEVLDFLKGCVARASMLVGHNISFDCRMVRIQCKRTKIDDFTERKPQRCTMRTATDICRIPALNGKAGYKWPKLTECMKHFFDEDFTEAHNAMHDVHATHRVYNRLLELGAWKEAA